MEWISFVLFALAALIHIGFFIAESILFQRPGGHRIFGLKESDVLAVRPWAFNQGFYNLFLALGTLLGLYFVLKMQIMLAGVLTGFCAVSMIGAGLALWWSVPRLRRFALIQMLPPLLGLLFLYFHVSRYL